MIAAAHQHRDAVGEAEYRIHVVLDQQHRARPRSCCDQLFHALRLVGAHAGHRLVEQHQARPGRQRQADLERPLLAVRQRVDRSSGRSPSQTPTARRALRRRAIGRAQRLPEAQARPVAACSASATLLQHREALEQAGDLERARQPAPRALVRRQAGDVVAGEDDAPASGRKRARRAVPPASSCRRRWGRSARALRRARTCRSTPALATTPPKRLRQALHLEQRSAGAVIAACTLAQRCRRARGARTGRRPAAPARGRAASAACSWTAPPRSSSSTTAPSDAAIQIADAAEDHHHHQRAGLRPVQQVGARRSPCLVERAARRQAPPPRRRSRSRSACTGRSGSRAPPCASRFRGSPGSRGRSANARSAPADTGTRPDMASDDVIESGVVLQVQTEADARTRASVEPVVAAVALERDDQVDTASARRPA